MAQRLLQGEERFNFAQRSAFHGERKVFYMLGLCFHYGCGCETSLENARQNYLLASELDFVDAMSNYGFFV
jgi:TPR repeat protein